ncbi:MAG: hypothetical protein DMG07_06285, partial [Acidobacteria bacterium]
MRYRPGEEGVIRLNITNTTDAPLAVAIEAEMAQEIARTTTLPKQSVKVFENETGAFQIPFKAPDREYGATVRVRLMVNGKQVATAQDMFSVADNIWKVAIGADLNIMSSSGFPWMDPKAD